MKIFKINASPHRYTRFALAAIPFILTIAIYAYVSDQRRQENPEDKITPNLSMMIERVKQFTFAVNMDNQFDEDGEFVPYTGPRSFSEAYQQNGFQGVREYYQNGESQLWKDLMATSYRFVLALFLIYLSVFVGLFMGCLPYVDSLLYRYILFFDKIPALVLTPIIFIFVTVGNPAIITLIVIAVAPTIILDTYIKVKEIPSEQVIKGMTLDASTMENVFRITFSQIIPKVYDTIRLNFKSIINLLVVGELLGASAGLGKRIFLVRRYMDMATIIPYIIIFACLIFALDYIVRRYIQNNYTWLNK